LIDCRAVARSKVTCVDAINVKNNVNNKKVVVSANDHALIKLLRQEKNMVLKGVYRRIF